MILMILVIYLVTVLAYFLVIRTILSKGLVFEINNIFNLVLIILFGLTPVGNITFMIIMIGDSGLYDMYKIKGDKILRKMLFVKDKRDKKWH